DKFMLIYFAHIRILILRSWKQTIVLEPISKIRLVFRARRETVKKRSIHVVCEHFEPFRNTAMGT
ncbi:MAG: hypothetical protein V3S72_11920, partial [Desulfobacterales bacterium]